MPEKHTFQAPRGTRDFYPEDMAVRRHIESVWRAVSINHGFEEIEGPNFEHLDLYTIKSGEGIVSELFSFQREGGETRYALRPEFTPTLARMYAARAKQLPQPTRWFVIPNHYRAERPQRGRLREFIQWNIDIIGDDSPRADAEIIACTIGVLEKLGLSPEQVRLRISHRGAIERTLVDFGLAPDKVEQGFALLDDAEKITLDEFTKRYEALGLEMQRIDQFVGAYMSLRSAAGAAVAATADAPAQTRSFHPRSFGMPELEPLQDELAALGVLEWCDYKPSLARGLAYYTGTVFEVHEAGGKERAIAGGGRYDQLVELFGGPPTPAVGIAMGDVVLRLVMEDHGLLKPGAEYMPSPDVFMIAARDDADAPLKRMVAHLRRAGHHVRHSYRSTRNVGKLLGEAAKVRARFAVILGDELKDGLVALKNLETGDQHLVGELELPAALAEALAIQRE